MNVNKVMICGRLGKDPELKYTPSGQAVANISIATSSRWTDKQGNKQERTEWHRVQVWGKLAEIVNQYSAKGAQLFVEGELRTREYQDKANVQKFVTEIIAHNIQLGPKPGGNSAGQGFGEPAAQNSYADQKGSGFGSSPSGQSSAPPGGFNFTQEDNPDFGDIPF